jgi:hypothetical protein
MKPLHGQSYVQGDHEQLVLPLADFALSENLAAAQNGSDVVLDRQGGRAPLLEFLPEQVVHHSISFLPQCGQRFATSTRPG